MHVARPGYGTSEQTFIIDGSGVYVTRNSAKYLYGRFELSYNKAHGNGINGLVVHKTDRARVIGNVLWDNGKVSKDEPESRSVEFFFFFSGIFFVKSNIDCICFHKTTLCWINSKCCN